MAFNSFLNNTRWHKALLFILSFAFYFNTIHLDYVLDDVLVITNNSFVKKGISGIPDILTHDSYFGASGKVAKASGGRYRPLSLVFFAIEKEFFGLKPAVFHFFNVFYYALLNLLLYVFLIKWVFKENPIAAFCATLLFLIHPVHTEVVANIKSRDEILSLLFMILTLNFSLKHIHTKKNYYLFLSLASLGLALLAKEHSLILLGMLPLTIYLFSSSTLKKAFLYSTPYWILISAYIFLRYNINKTTFVDEKDLMNSPYLLATFPEKIATIFWCLLQYIKMIFYPSPLSYDYSYNQIPYVTFSNVQAILSVVIYGTLVIATGFFLLKKNVTAYLMAFYLAAIFLISNLFVNIGTPMADRFLFTSGFFFIVAIVHLINKSFSKIKNINPIIPTSLLLLITVVSFASVYKRNKVWNNNNTLYFTDVKTATNSARALAFCGMTIVPETDAITDSLFRIQKLNEALSYFRQAYQIYPGFASMYQNWGGAYYRLNKVDSASWAWEQLKKLNPNSKFIEVNDDLLAKYYFNVYRKEYEIALKENNLPKMLYMYREAVKNYDKMPDSWVLLGQLYQLSNKSDSAEYAWKKCLEMDPKNQKAKEFLHR